MTRRDGESDVTDRYIGQLADALCRYQNDENFGTFGAVMVACYAVVGEKWARTELDENPAWREALRREPARYHASRHATHEAMRHLGRLSVKGAGDDEA